MTHLDVNQFSGQIPESLNRVTQDKERIILSSEGRDVAVLVPLDDLPALEELEDRLDVAAAERAEAEAAANGEVPISWEEAAAVSG